MPTYVWVCSIVNSSRVNDTSSTPAERTARGWIKQKWSLHFGSSQSSGLLILNAYSQTLPYPIHATILQCSQKRYYTPTSESKHLRQDDIDVTQFNGERARILSPDWYSESRLGPLSTPSQWLSNMNIHRNMGCYAWIKPLVQHMLRNLYHLLIDLNLYCPDGSIRKGNLHTLLNDIFLCSENLKRIHYKKSKKMKISIKLEWIPQTQQTSIIHGIL